MPWFKIKPERLNHISLFGYEIINETDEFIQVRRLDNNEIHILDKNDSNMIWLDDIGEAHQMGAEAIKLFGEENK